MNYNIKHLMHATFTGMKVSKDFDSIEDLKDSIETSLWLESECNDNDIGWYDNTYISNIVGVDIDSLTETEDGYTLNATIDFESEIDVVDNDHELVELENKFNESMYFETVGSFIIDTGSCESEIRFESSEIKNKEFEYLL